MPAACARPWKQCSSASYRLLLCYQRCSLPCLHHLTQLYHVAAAHAWTWTESAQAAELRHAAACHSCQQPVQSGLRMAALFICATSLL